MAANTVHRHRAAGDIVFVGAVILAGIIILHIILVLLDANGANDIVSTDADWAGWLATWFKNLFNPHDAKLAVVLNYGIAAAFYLAIGAFLRRVLNDL